MALVAVWGSAFALTRVAVASVNPWWVTALRIALGALLLWVVLRASGQSLPRDRAAWAWFTWLGAVGNVVPFALIAWGTQYIASSLAGILMAVMPIMVIVLAHWLLPDEPLTWRRAAAFGLGFLGVVLMIGPYAPDPSSLGGRAFAAELAMLLAAAGYALNGVTARRAPPMGGLVLATGVLVAAAVQATALALALAPLPSRADPAAVLCVLALAVFPTALGAAIVYPLLRRAGAGFVALSNYLVPMFALAVGVTLMDESLSLMDYAGLGLVLAGVALLRREGADVEKGTSV